MQLLHSWVECMEHHAFLIRHGQTKRFVLNLNQVIHRPIHDRHLSVTGHKQRPIDVLHPAGAASNKIFMTFSIMVA